MRFFEFIFLARKWKIDRPRISSNLSRAMQDGTPLWLLVFPEGTVITENTKRITGEYAKKHDITFNAKNVILPRSTGLYHIIRCLQSRSDYLFDITIGYSGLDQKSIPFDAYPPEKVFFEGNGPAAIHMHVNKFKISDIPGISSEVALEDEECTIEFQEWLKLRFEEKDILLQDFYRLGCFPEKSKGDGGIKQTLHINPKMMDFLSIAALLFVSIISWICFFF